MFAPSRNNYPEIRLTIMMVLALAMVLVAIFAFSYYFVALGIFWAYYIPFIIFQFPLPDMNRFRIR